MTDEIELAFAHPEARAAASAGPGPRDRISLRDHVVETEIGAFQPERGTTQRLRFNVVAEVRAASEPVADDVDRILSYDKITEAIAGELAAERLDLLETLAERVAGRILREPQAMRVFVRIEKLDRGPGALGVEIVRTHDEGAGERPMQGLRPVIVYLSNAAVGARDPGEWAELAGTPAVLCIGPGELPVPRTGNAEAQRRIDLLAIDQNAWALAGRDPRCTVVNTRTELDWAMTQDRISVWAPARMVLAAGQGQDPPAGEGVALAGWLAAQLGAARIIVIGDDPLAEWDIPAERREIGTPDDA